MKTAISLPDELFEAIDKAAEEDNISRSKIFTDAARNYLEQRKNQKLLAALNKAYTDEETSEEKRLKKYSKKYYAGKIAKERW